ncbi:unnamed protein product [Gongylonema pulchrum]|uniref:NPL4 domain-containing protein n=1 Tax=Gongylonema pulchrum TaxID=637853 RepID=A0A183DHV1_9BILA|nr:unnamed protein product [Gongylonema pulchrum]
MIGRYELFPEVPLGIKATVAAIYEPPQSSSADSLTLEDDPQEELVDELCSFLGLKRDSFFLTAQECITAGWLQNKYRNVTNFCSDGYFGSKFTTVVASGTVLDPLIWVFCQKISFFFVLRRVEHQCILTVRGRNGI